MTDNMNAMRESFECTGAGGEWQYEISADDPSVRYAWNIWREAWQAAVREAINEWEKPWREADGESFIQRLRKLETPNVAIKRLP